MAELDQNQVPAQPPAPNSDPVKKRLLLVEDDAYIREIYSREFSSNGFEVETAVDGHEGADKVGVNPPDVVLLDIMLPKMNGLDILKKIKENPATKSIPVIMLTNLAQDQTIKDATDLGADGYITKASMTSAEVVQEVKKKLSGQ